MVYFDLSLYFDFFDVLSKLRTGIVSMSHFICCLNVKQFSKLKYVLSDSAIGCRCPCDDLHEMLPFSFHLGHCRASGYLNPDHDRYFVTAPCDDKINFR